MTRRTPAAAARRAVEDELLMRLIAHVPLRVQEPEDDEDWEEQAFWALTNRRERKWLRNEAGELEHPTATFVRMGIASIRAGKPSRLFMDFLEGLAIRAERRDVLRFMDPRWLPMNTRSRELQLLYEKIASDFKDYDRRVVVRKTGKPMSYEDMKRQFKKQSRYQEKTIDRALAAHGLSVPSRRKRPGHSASGVPTETPKS
jgi:hypothetical protein